MRVTVAVNNELTWQSLPPGIVEVMPDGERRQRQYHDFFNYAGLNRSVWLYSTPTTYIADLTVVTELDSHTGLVRSKVSRGRCTKSGLYGWSCAMQTICSSPRSRSVMPC